MQCYKYMVTGRWQHCNLNILSVNQCIVLAGCTIYILLSSPCHTSTSNGTSWLLIPV